MSTIFHASIFNSLRFLKYYIYAKIGIINKSATEIQINFMYNRIYKIILRNIFIIESHVHQIIILFLASAHVRVTSNEDAQRHVNDASNDLIEDLPVFEPTAANVSAFVGQTAYLPCRVRNLGDKVVSLFFYNCIVTFYCKHQTRILSYIIMNLIKFYIIYFIQCL